MIDFTKLITPKGQLSYTREAKELIKSIDIGEYPDAKTFLHCAYHGIEPRRCPNCHCILEAHSFKGGWLERQVYCSRGCYHSETGAALSDERRKITTRKKYGVDSVSSIPSVRKKAEETTLDRYGARYYMQTDEGSKRFVETMMKRYGVARPLESPDIFNGMKYNLLEKYGVDNPSKLEEVKRKKVKTSIKNFGVEYPSQSPIIKERVRKTNLEKYGVEYFSQSAEYREKMSAYYSDSMTKPQSVVSGFLSANDIGHTINDRSVITPLEIDIWIPDHKIGIEVNGVYWHSSGNKEEDGNWRNRHLFKTSVMRQSGYRLIHLTDVEINTKPEICLSMIASVIDKTEKIAARKCDIISVDSSVARCWFNETHIQGHAPCSIHYGLSYDGELVSVMGFTKSRFDRSYDWELVRFSSRLNTTVVGGFSKLLKHFRKHHSGLIVSYADYSRSNGDVYRRNGFGEVSLSKPSYRWVDRRNCLHNRHSFMRRNLPNILENFDPSLTEAENCWNHGYRRLWDCGQLKFVLDK